MRTRPLCAYPLRAVYNGSGSIDDEKNFTCSQVTFRPWPERRYCGQPVCGSPLNTFSAVL